MSETDRLPRHSASGSPPASPQPSPKSNGHSAPSPLSSPLGHPTLVRLSSKNNLAALLNADATNATALATIDDDVQLSLPPSVADATLAALLEVRDGASVQSTQQLALSAPSASLMKRLDGLAKQRSPSNDDLRQTANDGHNHIAPTVSPVLSRLDSLHQRVVSFKEFVETITETPLDDDDDAGYVRPPKSSARTTSAASHTSPTQTSPSRPILKHRDDGVVKDQAQRWMRESEREKRWIKELTVGASLTKYNAAGKPAKRYFAVSHDAHELMWSKNKQTIEAADESHIETADSTSPANAGGNTTATANANANANASIFSKFKRILSWADPIRIRCLIDVIGVHYGPFFSKRFERFLRRRDGASGAPWLCISVEFNDRTLDIVCDNEKQVTVWFLGLQSLAPMSVFHLSLGGVLWQRLIMKLNVYGLGPIT